MNATLTHTKQGRLSSSNTTLLLLFFCLTIFANSVRANVTITRATGGSISADKAANAISPAYTTLGMIRLTEGATSDFATGTNLTFTLNSPAGWNFNPAANITVSATAGRNITGQTILSKTATVITVQFNVTGTNLADVLTISGVQVWALDGAKQAVNENITSGGTATIAGCAAGVNLGTLATTVGAPKLVLTLPGQTLTDATTFAGSGFTGTPSTRTSSTSFSISRITACDQFYNRVTTYSGAKTISYSGPGTAVNAPTYTTAVTFTSGRSSTTLTTILTKAEVTNLTVTDGTVSGLTSVNFTVQPGTHNNFLVEANGGGNIGTQIAGVPFNLQLTARDIENNTCSSGTNVFTGTVNLTSTGTLTTGGGTSASFVAGVLTGKVVNISNSGNHTITVTRTASSQTGTSNTFVVENPVPTVSSISAPCKTTGSSDFTLTVTGTNFNSSTVINIDGVSRATTYVSATSVQATILAADMNVDAIKSITAFNPTPGGGTSSSVIMTVSATPVIGTQPVSQQICTGSTAVFSVAASGFGITYKWQKNGVDLVDGGNISGVNTSTLTITNANAADASSAYRVVIGSACFADVNSNLVSLVVDPETVGGTLSGSDTFCIGNATGTLNLSSNTESVIQWEWSTDNFATAGNIISNTTGSHNYSNLLVTTYFRVLVQSGVCADSYSTVATVNVNTLPAIPPDPTASSPQCIDSTVTLTRLTSPGGETWYWQASPSGTSISESGMNKYVSTSGTYFLRSQNDLTSCWSNGAGSVTVTLNAASTGSQTLSVCDGTTVTLPDGVNVTTSGTYFSHLLNSNGCDSTITTNLTVIPNTTSTQTVSIC
ncbi:MAG: beta strand repeat-containing protein, partial [Bacteroidota bacterium]